MKYKFTFEDGSEYLVHYGVQGMRHGVRKEYVKKMGTPNVGKQNVQSLAERMNKVSKFKNLFSKKKAKTKKARNGFSQLKLKAERDYSEANSDYKRISSTQKHGRKYF